MSQLAGLIAAPEESGTSGIDSETLRRIQLFRGLILRVKHAFIWSTAPLTFARLERTGLLLRAFTDFGINGPLAAFDGTPKERTQRFLAYLSQATLPADARVTGVACHELRLLFSTPEEATGPRVWTLPTQSSQVRLATGVKIEAYDGRPDHCAGASLSSIDSAAVLVFYRFGRCSIVQDVAQVESIRLALAGNSLGSIFPNPEKSLLQGDFLLFEDLCADGFLVVERVWTL